MSSPVESGRGRLRRELVHVARADRARAVARLAKDRSLKPELAAFSRFSLREFARAGGNLARAREEVREQPVVAQHAVPGFRRIRADPLNAVEQLGEARVRLASFKTGGDLRARAREVVTRAISDAEVGEAPVPLLAQLRKPREELRAPRGRALEKKRLDPAAFARRARVHDERDGAKNRRPVRVAKHLTAGVERGHRHAQQPAVGVRPRAGDPGLVRADVETALLGVGSRSAEVAFDPELARAALGLRVGDAPRIRVGIEDLGRRVAGRDRGPALREVRGRAVEISHELARVVIEPRELESGGDAGRGIGLARDRDGRVGARGGRRRCPRELALHRRAHRAERLAKRTRLRGVRARGRERVGLAAEFGRVHPRCPRENREIRHSLRTNQKARGLGLDAVRVQRRARDGDRALHTRRNGSADTGVARPRGRVAEVAGARGFRGWGIGEEAIERVAGLGAGGGSGRCSGSRTGSGSVRVPGCGSSRAPCRRPRRAPGRRPARVPVRDDDPVSGASPGGRRARRMSQELERA